MNYPRFLTVMILVPLILVACGDDGPDCAEPLDISARNLTFNLTLDADARFDSGLSYRYPSGWRLTRVSGSQHEISLPEHPSLVIRVVDTSALTALGMPSTLSMNESDFNTYVEAFYPDDDVTGFNSGNAAGRDFAGGTIALDCDGVASVTLFNNLNGTVVALDIRSEAGPIPDRFRNVGFEISRILDGTGG
jgi:hypothetical protein